MNMGRIREVNLSLVAPHMILQVINPVRNEEITSFGWENLVTCATWRRSMYLAGLRCCFWRCRSVSRAARLRLLASLTVISLIVLKVPNWGHLHWRSYWQSINPQPVDFGGPSIVFLTGKPMAYIVPSLPADTRYAGVYGDIDMSATDDTSFSLTLKQDLLTSPAPRLKEVDWGVTPSISTAILASYRLTVTPQCQTLRIASQTLRICDVARVP